jgi:putative oxidoreductase
MKFLPPPSPDIGNLFLRLGTGVTMFIHGWLKFAGGEAFLKTVGTNWSAVLGLHSQPLYWGIFVAVCQTLGGILIALGLLARPASLVLTFVMTIGAIMVFEKAGTSFKDWSHPAEAALTCFAIAIMGSGRFGLDRVLGKAS